MCNIKGQSWAWRDWGLHELQYCFLQQGSAGEPLWDYSHNITATGEGGEGGEAAGAGEGLRLAADEAKNHNNKDNGNLLRIVKVVIIVFSRFINFGKSALLTLLAY